MFGICFVWVYIIKEKVIPLVKSASIGRLCKCAFSYAYRIVSYVCPKSFYIKGNKTAFKGFIVVQIFTTICRPFSIY